MTYIVKHLGEPKKAKTLKGRNVTRQEALFVQEYGAMIKCAPYDDHFLYHDPSNPAGTVYFCTCGSPAVVVPPGPRGLFVCLFHATYGNHITSYVNVKDFADVAGRTVEVAGKYTRMR